MKRSETVNVKTGYEPRSNVYKDFLNSLDWRLKLVIASSLVLGALLVLAR